MSLINMEKVNHPSHYQIGKIEVLDVIEQTLNGIPSLNTDIAFSHGNAIKYLLRAGRKGDYLEDIKKCIWYLQRIVKLLEEF